MRRLASAIATSLKTFLIHGDNLLALKALERSFAGRVKCIYIDPPYNTGQALPHYDDGLEHSIWLSLMKERLDILRSLLKSDGLLFCQLNDDEMAYGKVLLDEVFGRKNFLNQVSVKMKQTSGASGGGEDKRLKKNVEYLLIYAKDKDGDAGFNKFNDVYDEEDLFELMQEMRDEGKSWKYTRILRNLGRKEFVRQIEDGSGEPIKIFRHDGVVIEPISAVMEREDLSEEEAYVKYFDKIFRDTNAQSSIRTRVMEAVSGTGDFFQYRIHPTIREEKRQNDHALLQRCQLRFGGMAIRRCCQERFPTRQTREGRHILGGISTQQFNKGRWSAIPSRQETRGAYSEDS